MNNITAIRPYGYMIFAAFLLAVFGASGKVGEPVTLLVFIRFFVPFLLLCLMLRKEILTHITNLRTVSFIRTIANLLNQYSYFIAVKYISLLSASALVNTAPIFILLFTVMFHGRASFTNWLGVILGFIGTLLIINPSTTLNWYLLLGLLAGISWGASNYLLSVALKELPNTSCLVHYFFLGSICSMVIAIIGGPSVFRNINMDWQFFIGVMIFSMSTIGFQFFTGLAYKLRPVSELVPLLYLSVLFSALFDIFIFKSHITVMAAMGAVLIFFATLLVNQKNDLQFLRKIKKFIKNDEGKNAASS
jgi:drug/metabolite transporter (DMT)-like permease